MASRIVKILTALMVTCGIAVGSTWAEPTDSPPTFKAGAQRAIPGRYIVVFKSEAVQNVAIEADRLLRTLGGRRLQVFEHVLRGFSAELPDVACRRSHSSSRTSGSG